MAACDASNFGSHNGGRTRAAPLIAEAAGITFQSAISQHPLRNSEAVALSGLPHLDLDAESNIRRGVETAL